MNWTKLMPRVLVCAVAALLARGADVTLSNAQNTQLRIKCDSSNCRVREKVPGGKWRTIENAQAGSRTFDTLRDKYRQAGFQ